MTDTKKKFKTRIEIANDWGISRKSLYTKLKDAGLKIPSGKINQENQEIIYKVLKSS